MKEKMIYETPTIILSITSERDFLDVSGGVSFGNGFGDDYAVDDY